MPAPEALTRLNHDPMLFSALLTDEALPTAGAPPTAGAAPADSTVPQADTGVEHGAVDAGPGEFRLLLPVAGGYALVLEVDPTLGERTLGLRGPASSEPVRLAGAHRGVPSPAALTFAELELCARVIALEDPWLPHPGPVVALLSRFAPTAAEEGPVAREVVSAALGSLRYDVPPADHPTGPEQTPLPLFTDDAWWPRPPRPDGRVLTDEQIAAILVSPSAGGGVRRTDRFPAEDLAELVRLARARLARLPGEPGCDDARALALAREIAASADLRRVPELLAALTEAGCDHPTVLDALSEPLAPVAACWMVETLAGAGWESVLHRYLEGGAD